MNTRSAVGRLLVVVGLAIVALVSTGAAALPDMSPEQRVVADFEMDAIDLAAVGEAAATAKALVFVSSDLSAYGYTDLVLKDIERRWTNEHGSDENVLVIDLASNTLWSSESSKPTYCAADASTADCISHRSTMPNLITEIGKSGPFGLVTYLSKLMGTWFVIFFAVVLLFLVVGVTSRR